MFARVSRSLLHKRALPRYLGLSSPRWASAYSASASPSSALLVQKAQQDRWFVPGCALASVMALTAMVSLNDDHPLTAQNEAAFQLVDNNNNGESSMMDGFSSNMSLQFRILQRLDAKEELQKVRVARFLRDLHDLALEKKKEEQKVTLTRRVTKHLSRTSTNTGIVLPRTDLKDLTPQQAWELIDLLHAGNTLSRKSLLRLADAATQVFQNEETVIDLRDSQKEITVVGDLHGELGSLNSVLELAGDLENNILVITGDYVDRGESSLEVFCTLLLLKLAHPNNVVLLRGNHEDELICSVYGFLDEIKNKYVGKKEQKAAWEAITGVFAALPIAARTESVLMMHGGLPSADFDLSRLVAITPEERAKVSTVVESRTEQEKLLEMILWSDPSYENGIHENPRGCGIEFGPDVIADFLDRHNLQYIVRSHQPVEHGIEFINCAGPGGGHRGIVTVFSVAGYLDEASVGAVLKVNPNGTVRPMQFNPTSNEASVGREDHSASPYEDSLRPLLEEHRVQLTHAFQAIEEKEGHVTAANWARVMAEQLQLSDIPWLEIQPDIAPTTEPDVDSVDWRAHLKIVNGDDAQKLNENKDKLLSLFQFMDKDGNGMIDRQEFQDGISLLNRDHLPADQQIKNPDQFFNSIDVDGSGEIDMDEFSQALETSAALKSIGESLSDGTMASLKQNRELLLLAFEFLDADGSGAIDFGEFKTGVELVNARLPENQQFQDVEGLFEALDEDGSGDIDITELNQIFTLL